MFQNWTSQLCIAIIAHLMQHCNTDSSIDDLQCIMQSHVMKFVITQTDFSVLGGELSKQ